MFFFFFKQKTAYEMRISDWSSDVCSSDLHGGRLQGGDRRFLHGGPGQPPMQTGDEQGPEGADAGRLHRGGDAEEDDAKHQDDRSEERRVGKECVSKWSTRWTAYHSQQKSAN